MAQFAVIKDDISITTYSYTDALTAIKDEIKTEVDKRIRVINKRFNNHIWKFGNRRWG